MKKILITFALLLSLTLCLASCGGTNGNTEEEKYAAALDLIEDGKYEEAYEALTELGDYKDAKKMLSQFCYVPSSATYETDEEKMEVEFFYDEDNMPLRTVFTSNNGDEDSVEYTYDANKDLIKEFFVDSEYGETTYTYTYDENRNLIGEVYDHAQGTYFTVETVYDENGRPTKVTHTYPNDDLSYSYEYTYDEDGNVISESFSSSYGGDYTTVYTYENGKKIKGVTSYSDGDSSENIFTYDENGNLIKDAMVYEGTEDPIINYTYDENGNLIKKNCISEDSEIYFFEYTYDEHGNITKTVHKDSEGIIETTTIEFKLVFVSKDLTAKIKDVLAFDDL